MTMTTEPFHDTGTAPAQDPHPQIQQMAERLLGTRHTELSAEERRVLTRMAKRRRISRNANDEIADDRSRGERLADQVAAFGGSWGFVVGFLVFLLVWSLLNSAVLPPLGEAFDPYPYVFLNLILSMLAAIQAPIIMMSQNRQSAKDRIAANLDYEVNLKAELEIMSLHDKMDRLRSQQLEALIRQQSEQIALLRALLERHQGTAPPAGTPADPSADPA